jgi:hypothetical protein
LINRDFFCPPAPENTIAAVRWCCLQRCGTNFVSNTLRALDKGSLGSRFTLDDFALGLIDGRLDGLKVDCVVGHRVLSPFCTPELEKAVSAETRRYGALFDYHEAALMYERVFLAKFPERSGGLETPSRNPNFFVFQIRNPFDQVISAARALRTFKRNPGMTQMAPLIDFAWRMHKAWVIQVVEATERLDYPFAVVNYDRLIAEPVAGFSKVLDLVLAADIAVSAKPHIANALEQTSTDRVRQFEQTHNRALANDQRADKAGRIKSHVGNVDKGSGKDQIPVHIAEDIRAFYANPRYAQMFEDPSSDIF